MLDWLSFFFFFLCSVLTSEKSQNKKRKRGESGQGQSEGDDAKKKTRQQRPNYFVSIPICSAEVRLGETVLEGRGPSAVCSSEALCSLSAINITVMPCHRNCSEKQTTFKCIAVLCTSKNNGKILHGISLVTLGRYTPSSVLYYWRVGTMADFAATAAFRTLR